MADLGKNAIDTTEDDSTTKLESLIRSKIDTTEEEIEIFIKLIDQPTYKYHEEVSQSEWNDERGRFRVWARHIERLLEESGQNSMDSRLSRHYPISRSLARTHTEKLIPEFLQELQEEVREAQEYVAGDSSGGADNADDGDESDPSDDFVPLNDKTKLQLIGTFETASSFSRAEFLEHKENGARRRKGGIMRRWLHGRFAMTLTRSSQCTMYE